MVFVKKEIKNVICFVNKPIKVFNTDKKIWVVIFFNFDSLLKVVDYSIQLTFI
jgi:hypothetical protein